MVGWARGRGGCLESLWFAVVGGGKGGGGGKVRMRRWRVVCVKMMGAAVLCARV